MLKRLSFFTASVALLCSAVSGATIVLDSFESNEGHFDVEPSFSESTIGITAATSTADQDFAEAFAGVASQRLVIDDDPNTVAPTGPWRVRHLSGRGLPENNIPFSSTGFVGYFLKTTTLNLEASLMIDDGMALERARFQPIIADGQWHLYEWDLADEMDWVPFAGMNPNGIIDAPTVTLDSVYVVALFDGATTDYNATFFIDEVSVNAEGRIPIPEPSAGLLLAFAAAAAAFAIPARTVQFRTRDGKGRPT